MSFGYNIEESVWRLGAHTEKPSKISPEAAGTSCDLPRPKPAYTIRFWEMLLQSRETTMPVAF
jgi:hypothetical protein